jgi:hypothetical protein
VSAVAPAIVRLPAISSAAIVLSHSRPLLTIAGNLGTLVETRSIINRSRSVVEGA